jgi:hypothetical protein
MILRLLVRHVVLFSTPGNRSSGDAEVAFGTPTMDSSSSRYRTTK